MEAKADRVRPCHIGQSALVDAKAAQWIAAKQGLANLEQPNDDEFVITDCERTSKDSAEMTTVSPLLADHFSAEERLSLRIS